MRFKVRPIAWLPLEKGIPIHENIIWNHLSFTQKLSSDSTRWTYMVFSSPRLWPKEDCEYLEQVILQQQSEMKDYPFSEAEKKKVRSLTKVRVSSEKETVIEIPD